MKFLPDILVVDCPKTMTAVNNSPRFAICPNLRLAFLSEKVIFAAITDKREIYARI